MNKFEFFPIKCRIQRAAELQQQFNEKYKGHGTDREQQQQKKLNMKV